MGRAWQYFKCKNCGKDGLLSAGNGGSYVCECQQTVYYSAEVEEAWLNEKDSNGERIRMDFTGSDEEDCRRNAANHFGCEKEDIQNYYIVQKGGFLKKFIICATRPIIYEKDDDAIRILMWEYDNRPRIWADINLEKKTILYPYVLGNEKQSFEKIMGIKKSKNTDACKDFILILEPQGELKFSFYPGYFGDIDTLLQIGNEHVAHISHGMFVEKLSGRVPFEAEAGVYLEISSADFYLSGRMRSWKKEDKICLLNTDSCEGIDILINDIKYYRLIGQKYVTTEITGGGGGGFSIKGAVIGGLIAGDAGAIIGSRKEVDAVRGTSTVHDEQAVLLYSKDLKQVITFNSNAYGVFTKLIPEKDYEVVNQSNNEKMNVLGDNTKNTADVVREYKKLMDEGIITQEEFDKKKKELLGL